MRKQILFLQLPRPDNDAKGAPENVPLAAAYLDYSMQQAGEGEHVWPLLLRALRIGNRTDFLNTAWRVGNRFVRGTRAAPARNIARILPPPEHASNRPDGNGLAYMETGRGCGLPEQTESDVRQSVRWATGLRNTRLQFLHTLLLPGTELRRRRRELGLRAADVPPYQVISTPGLERGQIARIETRIARRTGRSWDCPAVRFVGHTLPDLFPERIALSVNEINRVGEVPGRHNRRAMVIRGGNLFSRRVAIVKLVRQCIDAEPFALWQFVLAPESEEPLDLIDLINEELEKHPPHFPDRMSAAASGGRKVSRRIFVKLTRGNRYAASWMRTVERNLENLFY